MVMLWRRKGGHWETPESEKHDNMGFPTVDDGFYSSGHPAPGSDKKNPFGIVKSTDEGKTLQFLDLYGQVDFHNMAVEKSDEWNKRRAHCFSRASKSGVYLSKDFGQNFEKIIANGQATSLYLVLPLKFRSFIIKSPSWWNKIIVL